MCFAYTPSRTPRKPGDTSGETVSRRRTQGTESALPFSVSFSYETEIMEKSVPHHQRPPFPWMLHPRTLYIL